jgi:hypothetical protein
MRVFWCTQGTSHSCGPSNTRAALRRSRFGAGAVVGGIFADFPVSWPGASARAIGSPYVRVIPRWRPPLRGGDRLLPFRRLLARLRHPGDSLFVLATGFLGGLARGTCILGRLFGCLLCGLEASPRFARLRLELLRRCERVIQCSLGYPGDFHRLPGPCRLSVSHRAKSVPHRCNKSWLLVRDRASKLPIAEMPQKPLQM